MGRVTINSRIAGGKLSAETPLTENERAVLSAVFARTNMGQSMPDEKSLLKAIERPMMLGRTPQATDFVPLFCGPFMESDEHEEIFNSEADGWWIEFGKHGQNTREYVCKTWPDMGKLFGWSQ